MGRPFVGDYLEGNDRHFLQALRIPMDYVVPELAEGEADVIADALIHGRAQVEYLTSPCCLNGRLLTAQGFEGRSLVMCAADGRCTGEYEHSEISECEDHE